MLQLIDAFPRQLKEAIEIGRAATLKTPKTLKPALYTYFCRVHPFMRGAFRVVPRSRKAS